MDEAAVISRILREQFPEACDGVGPSTVSEIVNGRLDFSTPPAGRFVDIWHLIQELAAATTLIRFLLEAYPMMKKASGRNPTKEDLKKKAEECKQAKGRELKDRQVDEIIVLVIRERESERGNPGKK
jgi:hypothetical protein